MDQDAQRSTRCAFAKHPSGIEFRGATLVVVVMAGLRAVPLAFKVLTDRLRVLQPDIAVDDNRNNHSDGSISEARDEVLSLVIEVPLFSEDRSRVERERRNDHHEDKAEDLCNPYIFFGFGPFLLRHGFIMTRWPHLTRAEGQKNFFCR